MKALLRLAVIALVAAPGFCHAQDAAEAPPQSAPHKTQSAPQTSPNPGSTTTQNPPQTPPNLENTDVAGEADAETRRELVHWNEYHGRYFTMRAGGGLLVDFAAYSQDEESKQQFALSPEFKLRDFRFLLNGKLLPNLGRSITWSAGIMYDAPSHSWLIRQTGVMIPVPKLWGNLFIGRAKEGFSLNKVMTGYDGWTMERFTMSDATIPLLADGIKWLGYSPKHGFAWNLGYFNDVFSKGQSFSSYSSQEVARLIWLPIHSEEERTLFHLGANFRYGKVAENKLRLKSRPEAFPAPFFLDTGTFDAKSAYMAGPEVYYRRGPWLFGSEYYFQNVSSKSTGNPQFQGGDVVATWLITGETRPYNTVGSYFKAISPKRPVFQGGPGAWELVFRFSYTDLDSGPVHGGKFRRFTPMVNWYLSENVRLEFAYGYGRLNRFDLKGNTQFFQSRLQLQL
jgi:phosphate-selective porin OprO and OprP